MARAPSRLALRPPGLAAVFGLAFMAWGVRIGIQPLSDNSFLTHLATGRHIVDHLDVPTRDLYSFTAPDTPWVVQSWLASAVYGGLDNLRQGHGIVVFNGVVAGLLGALVWRLTRPAVTLVPRVAIAAAATGVGTATWVERPLLVGLAAMAMVVVLTEDDGVPTWLAAPVLWIWINSHGSWPLGILLIGLRLAGTLLEERRRTLSPREKALVRWAAVGTVAAAVNPVGPRLLWFPFELVTDRMDILDNIVEWGAPNFRTTAQRVFLVSLLAGFVLLTRRRGRWADGLVLAAFGALALTSTRNMAVTSLVMIPVVARGLRDLGTLRGEQRGPLTVAAAGALVAFTGLLVASAVDEPAFELRPYPVAMLARLELGGTPEHVATQDFVGNLRGLLADAPEERVVFLDDRYDMWPRDLIDDYSTLLNATAGWEEVLDRRSIDAVVWDNAESLATVLAASDSWRISVTDGQWVLAERR